MNFIWIINEIINTVKKSKIDIDNHLNHISLIKQRENGKIFDFSEHLRGLIYSFLTNQRPWYLIVPKLKYIDCLFFNYDYALILNQNADYYIKKIKGLKCGNISISKQMKCLNDNIHKLLEIKDSFGNLDNFVTSKSPYVIATLLAKDDKYKIKYIGIALALEYLRNVGINEVKPDVHIRRILSTERLGICNSVYPSEKEVLDAISLIAKETEYSVAEIDAYLWMFCAKGYLEICGASPRCSICPVERLCNYKILYINPEVII